MQASSETIHLEQCRIYGSAIQGHLAEKQQCELNFMTNFLAMMYPHAVYLRKPLG